MAEFPTLADIFEPIEGKTGTEANEQMRRWYSGTRQLPGAAPSEVLTIVDDVIAPTSADVIVDTEGQAPADDLQIIKTDSTHDGMILSLRAANPDRVVTVVATGQLNGITLWNRAERYVLSTTEQLILQRDGNVWRESRGIGISLAGDTELTIENTEMAARASQLASLYFRTATLEGGIASLRPTSGDAGKIPMVDSVGGFELSNAVPIGKIELLPFRSTELPTGWYFCNGDQYPLSSTTGGALFNLSTNFKTDWGITVSGSNISIPNMFYTDGRGYFLRAVDGTTRRVGNTQTDTMRPITAAFSISRLGVTATYEGAFYDTGVMGAPAASSTGSYTNGVGLNSALLGDAYNGTETTPLNIGMTPAIFLGV